LRLPEIDNPDKYMDLYVVDFGGHSGVGFTADEVAELLESEKFNPVRDNKSTMPDGSQKRVVSNGIKVYRIYKAYPDGKMELKGVPSQIFQLEAGMFFYESDEAVARGDYKRLVNAAVSTAVPTKAKVHLAKYNNGKFATAIIYPAEKDEQISKWLLALDYKTQGAAEGGIEAVKRYYAEKPQILERHQLFEQGQIDSLTGAELLAATKRALVR
jgi:hypothetical protein